MSRGLGKTQRDILRYLVSTGPADVASLVWSIYDANSTDVYAVTPTVRRSLYGLNRAGLAKRTGRLQTRTGSYAVIWEATRAGSDLAGTWEPPTAGGYCGGQQ